jgi:uncharacterized lipoprotein NlpE involved in copper resistance
MKNLKAYTGLVIALIVSVILLQIMAWAYNKIPNQAQNTNQNQEIPESVFQIYNGILPCEDCEGIRTEITFNREVESKGDISGDFILYEQFLGKDDNAPIIEEGYWFAEILGNSETIITVNSKTGPRYFLLEEDSILMLDENKNIIDTELNYRLQRI